MNAMNMTGNVAGISSVSKPPSDAQIQQRGEEVTRVLDETRDESGLSEKAYAVLQKDWARFTSECNGNPPPPLPLEEANNDFFDYYSYMMKHGDKIKIGDHTDMKQVFTSDTDAAKQLLSADPRAKGREGEFFAMYMTHLVAQDGRIPSDYCFLKMPAHEYLESALMASKQELAGMR